VIQVEAIFMLLFGMIGKFGALFVTIPEPVIGGVFLVMFGEYTTTTTTTTTTNNNNNNNNNVDEIC